MQPPSQDDTQPDIQFSNQPQYQHLQPQMMLCPVQFIYEPQIIVPPGEQVPPNLTPTYQNQGYLLNVQNTPPWIQNRTNMVYMPPVQMNNMQPYMHQQMVQNPMYNYQYQPMIMHDQRHIPYMNQSVMQNPQMMQNVVQSPQSLSQNVMQNSSNQNSNVIPQNIIQTPMKLQIEQKETPVPNQMIHNNAPKQTQSQQDFMSPMQIIRPQYQSLRPQMIFVKPITIHTCAQPQNEIQPPPATTETVSDVPLQVLNQVPQGLSVKTVFKVPAPPEPVQNIAPVDDAHPRVYPKPVIKPPSNRDPQTNYKRKIREITEQNTKDESEVLAFKRNFLINRPDGINKLNSTVITVRTIPIANAFGAQNLGLVSNRPQNDQMHLQQDQATSIDRVQVKDKMLRNTVYVQARGIVNEPSKNEMPNLSIANNHNSMIKVRFGVPIENKETTNSSPAQDNSVNNSAVNTDHAFEENNNRNENIQMSQIVLSNGSSYIYNDSQMTETLPIYDSKTIQDGSDIRALLTKEIDVTITLDKSSSQTLPSIDANAIRDNSKSAQLSNIAESDDVKLQKNLKMAELPHHNDINKGTSQNKCELTLLSHDNESDDTKVRKNRKIKQFLHSDDADGTLTRNNSKMTQILLSKNADCKVKHKQPKIKSKELKIAQKEYKGRHKIDKMSDENVLKKEDSEMFVLTHVLDGYIIQESNVPFVITKPTVTRKKPTTIDDITSTNNVETEQASVEVSEDITEANEVAKATEIIKPEALNQKTELHTTETKEAETNDIEQVTESEMTEGSETAERNEDDPFEHLSIATVKSWTGADLSTYLMDYDAWQDTAQKLLEEEIDGESLLLANKEQLIQIGIDEVHADVLSAFLVREESKN